MCTVSTIGDMYADRWRYVPTAPPVQPNIYTGSIFGGVNKEEFDKLKAEVAEMKELLKAAKMVDTALGTPDCDDEAKLEVLRRVANLVGIDLSDVIGAKP